MSVHPSEICAVCGERATAWSSDVLTLENLVTLEQSDMVLSRGAWCAAHARSGSVQRMGFVDYPLGL